MPAEVVGECSENDISDMAVCSPRAKRNNLGNFQSFMQEAFHL